MVTGQEPAKSPRNQSFSHRSPAPVSRNGGTGEISGNIFSPRLKSIAAMAGWDEETLLLASLTVDDTPDREVKQRKRSDLIFKTPPSNSRRKRRDQRRSPVPVLATVLNLDEEPESQETSGVKANESSKKEETDDRKEDNKTEGSDPPASGPADNPASTVPTLPCLDKLREELSCAVCLDICYEPSTTACGHSFCKKCLRSAAEKCGKRCPKCRQLISSGRSCTVNTVLWNTIQLLFPEEVESRKASSRSSSESVGQGIESDRQGQRDNQTQRTGRRRTRPSATSSSSTVEAETLRRRRASPNQDEDAALALRLQREEFLEVIRTGEAGGGRQRRRSGHDHDRGHENSRISLSLARENLRAMASRAISLRVRTRPT